jgi:hypothetical protein
MAPKNRLSTFHPWSRLPAELKLQVLGHVLSTTTGIYLEPSRALRHLDGLIDANARNQELADSVLGAELYGGVDEEKGKCLEFSRALQLEQLDRYAEHRAR